MKTTVESNLSYSIRANTGRPSLQPLLLSLCIFCKEPADPQSADVIIETCGRLLLGDPITQIWHRSCYDDFLDQGEET